MVEQQDINLDRTYAALSDPTRREILSRLMKHEARVTELAEPFDMSFNAVSKHVRVLERAGLVRREIRGREHYLSLDATDLALSSTMLLLAAQSLESRPKLWVTAPKVIRRLRWITSCRQMLIFPPMSR